MYCKVGSNVLETEQYLSKKVGQLALSSFISLLGKTKWMSFEGFASST
jgi:hypothetical protein